MSNNYQQKLIHSFRHWTRKSYAIFQSLKLQIKISSLSVAMLLVGLAQEANAQSNKPRQNSQEYSLDTLEVMGELTPVLETELAREVQAIEVRSLELVSINSIQETLNQIAGVDLRQRGNNDVQSDLSLRGSSFDQVQILLNGFDMTDPQTGHHSLNLPISFQQLSRAEVLIGAASRVLGPNAYAGAVNFVTDIPKKNAVAADFSVGDFGLYDITSSIKLKQKYFSHFLSVNYATSKGYIENTDFKKATFFYYGNYAAKKALLSWQFSYSDKAFGANSFYTPKYPYQFEELNTLFAGLKLKTKGKISTLTTAHFRANADRFELIRDGYEKPIWYKNHNYHRSNVVQVSSKAWHWWKLGKTTIAANVRHEEIYSNMLGSETIDTIIPVINNNGYYNKYASRLYTTASLEHVYRINNLKIAAGLMYYYFPKGNNENGLYPGIDLSYNISSNIKILAGINTGMRLPTFTDLYYNGPSNIGNPDLIAESQVSYQLGSKFRYKKFKLSIQSFYNDANNSIDWVRKSDTIKWQPINITNVQSYGFDIGLRINLNEFGVKCFNSINISYSFLDKKSSSQEYQSHYVMDYLKHKFIISFNHKIYKGVSLGYTYRFNSRVGEYQNYNADSKTFLPEPYKAYNLLDLRLSWKTNSWLLFADLKNVFDVSYQDYGNIEQAGRWFSIGARYNVEL